MPAILMSDEGVHEIQLNGKQLVFMFMAVTVVAVVIFLCGVMVGRGVRPPRATGTPDASLETPADPTAPVQAAPVTSDSIASAAGAAGGAGTTATNPEKLTYSDRLGSPTSAPETLREPVLRNLSAPAAAPIKKTPPIEKAPEIERTAKKAPPAEAKPDSKAEAPKKEPKPAADLPTSGGEGFVVQVAAVKARNEADTIAKRLASKGFPSFVTTPGPGTAGVYRVRVGKFSDRKDAETVARRLEKEEQFKPWITR
jgi:DedD protein